MGAWPSALSAFRFSPSLTLRVHSDADFRLRDLRIVQPWASGPSEGAPGPHLLSINEYRPHRLRDVIPISLLTAMLVRDFVEIEDAVGIATGYQPLGQITYSLSVWKSEEARHAFTISARHRKVMVEYRSRGYLRHIHWWGEFTTIAAGWAEATRRLDAGEGRRVGEARDRWAREDKRQLAQIAAADARATAA